MERQRLHTERSQLVQAAQTLRTHFAYDSNGNVMCGNHCNVQQFIIARSVFFKFAQSTQVDRDKLQVRGGQTLRAKAAVDYFTQRDDSITR